MRAASLLGSRIWLKHCLLMLCTCLENERSESNHTPRLLTVDGELCAICDLILRCMALTLFKGVAFFLICFKTLNNNRLIWFQLKVIYRILGTQRYLNKLGLNDTLCCLFVINHRPCCIFFITFLIQGRFGMILKTY